MLRLGKYTKLAVSVSALLVVAACSSTPTQETVPEPAPVYTPPPQPVMPPAAVEVPATPMPIGQSYHTVSSGDTLYNISKRYGCTVDDLKRWNGLTSNNIGIGQKLKVAP